MKALTDRQPYKEYQVEVINAHKDRGLSGVFIGRPSPLGNPFPMQTGVATRDEVCDRYAKYFHDKVQNDDPKVLAALLDIHRRGKSFGTVRLVCFCKPKRCHGDTIAAFIANNQDFLEELASLS